MKNFDYYGQLVLIIAGSILAIDCKGFGILFSGLAMFVLGVWQVLSSVANLATHGCIYKPFFRTNLVVALVYTVMALLLSYTRQGFSVTIKDVTWFVMMAIPPVLIIRYWIAIGKMYGVGFFKAKTIDGKQ